MGLYEDEFDTTWTSLDKDEATERAYALGVAESLGEYNREEFEAVHDEMGTSYDQSMVELAFREGKNEAKEIQYDRDQEDTIWSELVEDEEELVTVDEDDLPTGGRDGIPDAVDQMDALDRPNPDEIDATDKPDFLDR